MEAKHVEESTTKGYENLGPSYFSARDTAQRIMDGFEAEQFKPLIDKFSKQFAEEMWQAVESSLMSDTECNIQGNVWRDVDVDKCLGAYKPSARQTRTSLRWLNGLVGRGEWPDERFQ